MCSNLLLQLGHRAPHNTSSDQSLCFFCPAQDEVLQALIFLHLSLCLLTRETSPERQKNSCKINNDQSINRKGTQVCVTQGGLYGLLNRRDASPSSVCWLFPGLAVRCGTAALSIWSQHHRAVYTAKGSALQTPALTLLTLPESDCSIHTLHKKTVRTVKRKKVKIMRWVKG